MSFIYSPGIDGQYGSWYKGTVRNIDCRLNPDRLSALLNVGETNSVNAGGVVACESFVEYERVAGDSDDLPSFAHRRNGDDVARAKLPTLGPPRRRRSRRNQPYVSP